MSELVQDNRNLNKGTEKGKELIGKSLRQFGAGRSVLIDKNNRIIAGNKTHENAVELGMDDVIVVETDGSKLVAVKRTDIDLDTKKGREMALADNATVKVDLEWDAEELNAITEDFDIDMDEWGFEMSNEEQPKQPKDIADDFQFEYKVEIACVDEREQEKIYNEMRERGFECRILTL